MPIITPGTGTRNQAIIDLIESVALQETALSHMLNAEGEKMQAIINTPGVTREQLMALNNSVYTMLSAVTRLEVVLQGKLELFASVKPDPTAASELAKIRVPSVLINVPLNDPAAESDAIAQAVAAAQAQVAPGFTVSFTPASYTPGTLTGLFTVTNDANPSDVATDPADRTITVNTTATDAPTELAKINVTSVTIPVPLTDPFAEHDAIIKAIAAAQAQVVPGYTVSFTPTLYDPITATLTGKFTVVNDTNPTDTATDVTDRTIAVISTATTAPAELAKISVTTVTINVPLNDPAAEQDAIDQAVATAQAQVDPGYTVSFTPVSYTPGTLTGKFTVTNDTNPTDAATDAANRTIAVVTTATDAPAELAKINVPSVTIAVPLYDPTAENAAVAQAVAAAQAQVDSGYTVSFVPTSYVGPPGTLTGKFTVINNTNPADVATDAADRTIAVISTAPTAATELAKINVPYVNIDVPLNDPAAELDAINAAIAAAQAQVDPGFTVSFTPTGYDDINGILTGKFTVTNNAYPADTATDAADRTIPVHTTMAIATSNASAQFLSGTLLDGNLSGIAGIAGVSAQFINGSSTPPSVTNYGTLDVTALGTTLVNVGGVSIPLDQFLQLGAVNQYAQASVNGASRSFAGAVSNAGVVSIGGSTQFPSNAKLDLMKVIGSSPLLTQADLSVGAIIGADQWSAALGSTIANTTDVTNPLQGRAYNIADLGLNLQSPIIGDFVNTLNTIADTASLAVSGLGSSIINGLLGGVNAIMAPLSVLVPGLSIGTNDLNVTVNVVDLKTELAPILQVPVTSGDGAVTVDFSTGTITVDFSKLVGLNTLPPNTDLLSSTVINALVADLQEIVLAMQGKLQALVMSKLTGTAAVTISGGVNLASFPTPTKLNINYSGSLADLLTGAKSITLTGTGLLIPIAGTLNTFASTVQNGVATVVNPLINDPTTGILPVAINGIASAATSLSNTLSPVFNLISTLISIIINVQQTTTIGPDTTFTEIPIEFNLLSSGATLDLGKVTVGPNSYTL